ncbi:MAG: EVE domain-containing protein [Kiritimatiellae bacterium]|nr:EVE domain-containing protein [Kiritimatiellia bacterium]MDW8459248.1 EVE domain-containing protein [Verrucomicrobiota bacterium]
MAYWLMKSEPSVYSIDDLAREGRTPWTGVRNYQARNFMRDQMREGDIVFFYHSSAEPPGIAGLARVVGKPYPDPTQFDPKSPYYDPRAHADRPVWFLVDVAFERKVEPIITLTELRAEKRLRDMLVLKRGQRLSVQPVSAEHARVLMEMIRARGT